MPLSLLFEFILLAALWGASFMVMRMAVHEIGPIPLAALRVLIAALCLWPLMQWRGLGPQFRRHWKAACLVGIVSSAVPFVLFAFAVLSISTGLTAILNATVPLFGAIIAWLWLKDRPGASRLVGLAIGFTGVALLSWDKANVRPEATGSAAAWAVLACLGATFCYAFSASATKRFLTGVPPLVTATGSQVGASIALAIPALLLWPDRMPSAHAWGAVLVSGVFCTGLAYLLYFRLIEKAGPSRAVTVTFAIPVFALFFGTVFLDERITAWMVGCGAIVLIGTMLAAGVVSLPARRPRDVASTPRV